MPEPATLTGIISLAVTNLSALIFILVRDRKRHKKEDGKNGQLDEVQSTLKCMDGKVGKINTNIATLASDMKNMKDHCKNTTKTFGEEIKNNREKIFNLVKEK